MLPVLFSIGNLNVSSFGAFLALGFLYGIFLIWRLARAWDLDEEKILDLTLLTFLGGLFGARLYFAIQNWQQFMVSPLNLILINKTPGFDFWGGFLGGWLTLYIFARRLRLDFWQLADIAVVGFLGGLILSNIGSLLSGHNPGIVSKAFFAVVQEGMVGKRWPVQAVETLLLLLGLLKIWSQATHFHPRGKVVGTGFIYIGVTGLILEPLKQNHPGGTFSLAITVLGLTVFYKAIKKNPLMHLKELGNFTVRATAEPEFRKAVVQILIRSCYNQKTNISWKLRNFKKMLRRFNVKFS